MKCDGGSQGEWRWRASLYSRRVRWEPCGRSQHRGLVTILHLLCDVRKSAAVLSSAFCLIEVHVQGMLSTCVAWEMRSRCEFLTGLCSTDTTMQKQCVLRLICSHGASRRTRHVHAAMCFTFRFESCPGTVSFWCMWNADRPCGDRGPPCFRHDIAALQ